MFSNIGKLLLVILVLALIPAMATAGPKEFFCAATAYDTSGNESVYSNEVQSNFDEGRDATFTWINPTTNEDGSPYDDPGGTNVYCGAATATYNQAWQVTDPSATTITVRVNPTKRPGPPRNYQRISEILKTLELQARGDEMVLTVPTDLNPA